MAPSTSSASSSSSRGSHDIPWRQKALESLRDWFQENSDRLEDHLNRQLALRPNDQAFIEKALEQYHHRMAELVAQRDEEHRNVIELSSGEELSTEEEDDETSSEPEPPPPVSLPPTAQIRPTPSPPRPPAATRPMMIPPSRTQSLPLNAFQQASPPATPPQPHAPVQVRPTPPAAFSRPPAPRSETRPKPARPHPTQPSQHTREGRTPIAHSTREGEHWQSTSPPPLQAPSHARDRFSPVAPPQSTATRPSPQTSREEGFLPSSSQPIRDRPRAPLATYSDDPQLPSNDVPQSIPQLAVRDDVPFQLPTTPLRQAHERDKPPPWMPFESARDRELPTPLSTSRDYRTPTQIREFDWRHRSPVSRDQAPWEQSVPYDDLPTPRVYRRPSVSPTADIDPPIPSLGTRGRERDLQSSSPASVRGREPSRSQTWHPAAARSAREHPALAREWNLRDQPSTLPFARDPDWHATATLSEEPDPLETQTPRPPIHEWQREVEASSSRLPPPIPLDWLPPTPESIRGPSRPTAPRPKSPSPHRPYSPPARPPSPFLVTPQTTKDFPEHHSSRLAREHERETNRLREMEDELASNAEWAKQREQHRIIEQEFREAKRKQEEEAKRKEEEIRRREEEAKKRQEEARKRAEYARRYAEAEEIKRQEEETRRREEVRRREEEVKRQRAAEEARRQAAAAAEEARRHEESRRHAEQARPPPERPSHNPRRSPEERRKPTENPRRDDNEEEERRRWEEQDARRRDEAERKYQQQQFRERAEKLEQALRDQQAQQASEKKRIEETWAKYEARWKDLHLLPSLKFQDIPWPLANPPSSPEDITAMAVASFILSPNHSQGKTRKIRIREALLIWHTDKFEGKWMAKVDPADKEIVSEGVSNVARCLSGLMTRESSFTA